MLETWLVALVIGGIVGFAMGSLASRKPKALVTYMLAGMLGASVYALYPVIFGDGYANSAPKITTIAAAAFTGLAILFVRVR